jgi:hypothetical protein
LAYFKGKEDSMLKCALRLTLVAGLAAGALSAANDPFLGEWKLNPAKSKLYDQMKVESAGGNKYAFNLGAGDETIVIDGTDQPGYGGTTLSVSVAGPDSWKVVRKRDGRMLLTAIWTLSGDGNALTDDFTSFAPNGSTYNVKYVYKRAAGGSGFVGTWVSTTQTVTSAVVIKVLPQEGDGLSFIDTSRDETRNVKFDGRDYPKVGPNVVPGATCSLRRLNDRTLEMTDKIDGKVIYRQQIELSPDGKTLTMTRHIDGQSEPNIRVFDRQ